jgi:putative ABC transport system permease protein
MTLLSLSDLRDALRSFRRAPAVPIAAVLCLSLGIGATTAVASAIDRALLSPLPYRSPDRLVTVYRTTPLADDWPTSAPNYVDLARRTQVLSGLAAIASGNGLLTFSDQSLAVTAERVTGNLFQTLGMRALRGRLLTPDDDRPGAAGTAVMSAAFWRQHFGADPAVVGRTVNLDGRPVEIVGIAPPGFRVVVGTNLYRSDLWVPMHFTASELGSRGSNFLFMIGRLASDATVETAESNLRQIFRGLVATYPDLKGDGVRVVPLRAEFVRTVRTPLLLIFGAVCAVLLIAAANVASLLLARGVQRQRETAVRAALGGGRWAVMRPVVAETAVLVSLGLVGGGALAWAGVRTIGALAVRNVPQLAGLTVDPRIIAFATALSIGTALACGIGPAWRAGAVDPQDALRGGRGGGAGRGHHRALAGLVVAEVALSLMLLVGASLVLRGFTALITSDPGFDPKPVLTFTVSWPADAYPGDSAVQRFLTPALAAIRRTPGVAAAGAISALPYDQWGSNFNVRYEGQPAGNLEHRPLVEFRAVTPGFFSVTRQRLVAGRLLDARDDGRPGTLDAVVVNEALAKRDFPGRGAIGQRFYWGGTDTSFATIVGVVSDIRNSGPFQPPKPAAYWTAPELGGIGLSAPIMVRTAGLDPTAIEAAVRAAVRSVDPRAAVSAMRPMDAVIGRSLGQPRFYFSLLAVFAAVALLLAMAGVYGVMSYAVVQRTREIGIRSALGSPTGRIVRLIATQGMLLIGFGIAIGFAGAAATVRLLRQLLYGVSPADPQSWLLATAALVIAGAVASLVPALRAARIDPLVTMKTE